MGADTTDNGALMLSTGLPGGNGNQGDDNGLMRGRVRGIQRARIVAAAGQVACEQGSAEATVSQIVKRAGVSRRTFYELFADCDECLLFAVRDALSRAHERVLAAWDSPGGGWRERARCSLAELLSLFDEDPVLARLLLVESLSASPAILAERTRALDSLIDALEEQVRHDAPNARALVDGDGAIARLSLEGAIGGMLGVLHARIAKRTPGCLVELSGPLMAMLVLPFHGPAAARREAMRPVPSSVVKHGASGEPKPLSDEDPFKKVGMRLTYRTVRVLRAIGEHPDSSNSRIATLAEVADQAQISKLLSRLERLSMISNGNETLGRGAANAWTLTPAGRQVTNRLGSADPAPVGRTG